MSRRATHLERRTQSSRRRNMQSLDQRLKEALVALAQAKAEHASAKLELTRQMAKFVVDAEIAASYSRLAAEQMKAQVELDQREQLLESGGKVTEQVIRARV